MTTGYPETADIETSSDSYASRFAGATGAWFLDVQERIVVSRLASSPRVPILDVGGGHGQLAGPLCCLGHPVTVLGSDASCGARIAPLVAAGQCRFETGNVLALPHADRSVDTVLCFRLLPHCTAWPALIHELARVASRAVIVDYPVQAGFNALAPALFGVKKKVEGNTRHWRMFTQAEVDGEFGRQDWACLSRTAQFFWPMALHRALRCRAVSRLLEAPCRALGLTGRWGSPVIAEYRRVS